MVGHVAANSIAVPLALHHLEWYIRTGRLHVIMYVFYSESDTGIKLTRTEILLKS